MKTRTNLEICILVIIGFFLMLTSSCKKEEDNDKSSPDRQVPLLTTFVVSDITQTTITCGGNITNDGGTIVTARGVCWSIGQTPSVSGNKTTDGTGAGSFTSVLTGLSANTTYYVRAYATNSAGTGYGSAMSFTTQKGTGEPVTDIDGNVYHQVAIGTQVWLAENLKVTHYRNGDPIPNVTDAAAWNNLTAGAYCDYENNPANNTIYGKLYTYYTVADSRKLCPAGWHIPTDAEWTTLTTYLGDNAGGKLKETGIAHWQSPNAGATNETGFTALPGGDRHDDGTFYDLGIYSTWWSSTEYFTNMAWYWGTENYDSNVGRASYNMKAGFSVRCVRD